MEVDLAQMGKKINLNIFKASSLSLAKLEQNKKETEASSSFGTHRLHHFRWQRIGNFKTDFLGVPKGKLYPSKSRMIDVLFRTPSSTSVAGSAK